VKECYRKLHNKELHILYSSPDIIRKNMSRKMRWVGHERREKCAQKFGWNFCKQYPTCSRHSGKSNHQPFEAGTRLNNI
jgi:hypothetical protein